MLQNYRVVNVCANSQNIQFGLVVSLGMLRHYLHEHAHLVRNRVRLAYQPDLFAATQEEIANFGLEQEVFLVDSEEPPEVKLAGNIVFVLVNGQLLELAN